MRSIRWLLPNGQTCHMASCATNVRVKDLDNPSGLDHSQLPSHILSCRKTRHRPSLVTSTCRPRHNPKPELLTSKQKPSHQNFQGLALQTVLLCGRFAAAEVNSWDCEGISDSGLVWMRWPRLPKTNRRSQRRSRKECSWGLLRSENSSSEIYKGKSIKTHFQIRWPFLFLPLENRKKRLEHYYAGPACLDL